ncbi:MAG TPA: pilus assembly protein N-terminal domain-containing protein [Pirellulales bacterium]|nr:pilus assembly protein N-terminal domain-containing protein [Pirellulales bacterium]
MTIRALRRRAAPLRVLARKAVLWAVIAALVLPPSPPAATAAVEPPQAQAVVFKVQNTNERLEMVVNSSRILTMDQKIPQVQAANQDLVELTPLSATQVQLLAKKAGVTQVNLWDEEKKVHTIDVIIFPDARELAMLLQSQFPTTALRVVPTANSVILSGHVDDPNQISRIVAIAEDYYPKVINNITIAGVQQVLLKVKVLEVSRTKLRQLGFDFRAQSGQSFFQSAISQILGSSSGQFTPPPGPIPGLISTASSDTLHLSFGIVNQNSAFLGFLDALEKQQLATILAEPNLTAYSGRPASFSSGGQFPVPVPQSLGTISVQWKTYGTQVDFVPIVLGSNAIRLEVFPRVTEIDETHAAVINGQTVPALKIREANTGVEMRAGQTLAIAGLIQNRRDYAKRAVPLLGEIPYVGALFRNETGQDEEIELLIMVTPELVEALDPCDVPTEGPGTVTSSPTDFQMYFKGHIEVPRCPADDACRPSLSPGSLYEFSRPKGGGGPPGDPSGPALAPQEGSDEVIEAPAPEPGSASRRNTLLRSPPSAAARPRSTSQTGEAVPRARQVPASYNGDNRSASYRPNNRTSRPTTAQRNGSQSPPGIVGPVGYDVKN